MNGIIKDVILSSEKIELAKARFVLVNQLCQRFA
jgi:hypothetical protein